MNNISINIFIGKYLPDYKERYRRFRFTHTAYSNHEAELAFIRENHFEALENYTEIICKKQREICADNAHIEDVHPYLINLESISNAPQPKIEEI